MLYKLDNSEEFTDKPSYPSKPNEDRYEVLERMVDDWQQTDWVDQIGNNLE